ncbi:MAG: hypothetical protein R3C56_19150 [Pirellulaceae bacterium]
MVRQLPRAHCSPKHFQALLTGVDDSSVVEQKEKVSRAENRGKGQVLETLRSDLQTKMTSSIARVPLMNFVRSETIWLEQSVRYPVFLKLKKQDLAGIELERLRTWTELQRIESRQEVVEQLLVRLRCLPNSTNRIAAG